MQIQLLILERYRGLINFLQCRCLVAVIYFFTHCVKVIDGTLCPVIPKKIMLTFNLNLLFFKGLRACFDNSD